ncbi:MAG: TolC family protein [Anaeromyxobacteraceae bacterium]
MNPPRPIAALALALVTASAAVPSLAAAQAAPITLEDALARATRHNVELSLAREDAAVAGSDRVSALSNVLPRLDLSSTFGRSFIGAQSGYVTSTGIPVPAQPASDQAYYSLGATLSQPLFDWTAFQGVRASGYQLAAAEKQYDEQVLSTAFEVTRRFYEVVRAERTLAVLEKTAARTQDLVARADALFAAGRAPRADTYTNRVNLANDQINVERQRARVNAARTSLGQAIGLTGSEAANLTVAVPPVMDRTDLRPGQPPALDELIATAQKRRPAVAAAKAQVAAADASVQSAWGGYLPSVGAQVSYNRSGPELTGNAGVYGDLTREYSSSALVVASWNLFEGRRTQAQVQRAESSARRARTGEEATALRVAKEISDARAVAASGATQVGLAADNLATADKALSLARERLEAGLATQLEVREASLNLTRAELSLVEARIDHAVAIADLARASGGPL